MNFINIKYYYIITIFIFFKFYSKNNIKKNKIGNNNIDKKF